MHRRAMLCLIVAGFVGACDGSLDKTPAQDASWIGADGMLRPADGGASAADSQSTLSDSAALAEDSLLADLPPEAPEPDLIVALTGEDTPTCGSEAAPCRSVEYATEQRAQAGQTIGVEPGTYDEVGGIDVPTGVSITGLGGDAAAVVLRPDYDIGASEFFVRLVSAQPSQDGNQSLSYLTFEAHAPSHTGRHALHVQNRNNVRIHHCRFTNWDLETEPYWAARTIEVNTTYAFSEPTHKIAQAYPDDLGPPGDYSTWVDWPTDPVTNFEFDHNFVYRCGSGRRAAPGVEPSVRPGWALNAVNLKDARIHHNEFDLRGIYATAIKGIGGYWDNVDVYDNIFRSTDSFAEGWMGPKPPWKGSFVLEVWAHINGCEYTNNIANDGFSIMVHKESTIRHNILLRDRAHAIGIETGALHHSSVHHNYVVGGNGMGIAAQWPGSSAHREGAIYENIVKDVHNWGISLTMNWGFCRAGSAGATDLFVYNNVVDETKWGSFRVHADCQEVTPAVDVYVRNNIFTKAGDGWAGVNLELGPSYDSMKAVVENNLLYANAGGAGTSCRCVDTSNVTVACDDACAGRAAAGTISADPLFASEDIVIVDQSDDSATSRQGSWAATPSTDERSYSGGALMHAGGDGDHFEFRGEGLPTDSPTLIAIWWPRNLDAKRATAVPISVYDGASTIPLASYTVDQKSWDSSEWYYLGRHLFSSGTARVRVHSVAGAEVVADAVLFSKLGTGYKLRAGSPAIDAGKSTVTSVVEEDFFGGSVPRGAGPEIGIHER